MIVTNEKLENLMKIAIQKMEEAEKYETEASQHLADGNELEWETYQNLAIRNYGYAEGIKLALDTVGFHNNN